MARYKVKTKRGERLSAYHLFRVLVSDDFRSKCLDDDEDATAVAELLTSRFKIYDRVVIEKTKL